MAAQGNALGIGAHTRASPERAPQVNVCSALSGLWTMAVCLPRALPWAHMLLPLRGDALADAQREAGFTFSSRYCPEGRRRSLRLRASLQSAAPPGLGFFYAFGPRAHARGYMPGPRRGRDVLTTRRRLIPCCPTRTPKPLPPHLIDMICALCGVNLNVKAECERIASAKDTDAHVNRES